MKDNKWVRLVNGEMERLVCDNKKLLKYSFWRSKYDLKEGLIETINWFQEDRHFYEPGIYHI